MASHNLRGSHDQIQIKIQSVDSLVRTNDRQIQASLAIRTFFTKDLDSARHQARPHSSDAADASRCYDRRYHDGHRMAAAFGARLSRRSCAQKARFDSWFRIDRKRAGLADQG